MSNICIQMVAWVYLALMDRRDRQEAADLIHQVLALVESSDLSADGPAGMALARRLEGAEIAVRAIDGKTDENRSPHS